MREPLSGTLTIKRIAGKAIRPSVSCGFPKAGKKKPHAEAWGWRIG